MKSISYKDLLTMSEDQLRRLANNPKNRSAVVRILDERNRLRHNKVTYKQMTKCPNQTKKDGERYRNDKYGLYLRSKHWIGFRQKALDHFGRKCSECGRRKNLQVHHLHYRTLGQEDLLDVVVLCENCHQHRHPPERR